LNVGEHSFDRDVVAGEEAGGSLPERCCGGALFVGEDLAVGEACVAIDGGVHERVADFGAIPASPFGGPAVDAPPAAFGDATQLLDIDVDELAGSGHLDPSDRCSGHSIEVIESVELMTDQHPMGRRGMHADNPCDARGSEATAAAQRHDATFCGWLRTRG
jgi:hypothetical protein